MPPVIRLSLIGWTLLEVAAFVLAGRAVGVLGVLALVLLTALLGGALLRSQGARALSALRGGVRRGGDPLQLLLRDGFRLVAGLLLILPGLMGDVVGLLLLLPPVQRGVAGHLARRGLRPANLRGRPAGWPAQGGSSQGGPSQGGAGRPDVVEAEWVELEPPSAARDPREPPRRPSGWTQD